MEELQTRFVAAVTAHGHAMFRAARAVLSGDADAEDAVGEAVLRAWQSFDRLKNPAAAKAWLLKITVRCAYEQYRKTGRMTYLEDMEAVAGAAAEEPPSDGLWDAVCALPVDSRVIVTLFYYEDMPVAEIAKALGVAQGTVKSRLSRARARLKLQLGEEAWR